jgi:hypothetical protein
LVEAARAVLDAVSLGWSGKPSDANVALAGLTAGLAEWSERLARGGALPEPISDAVLSALDDEIARWEARSATDAEARAVLRAFLGVREILWELGVRPDDAARRSEADSSRAHSSDARRDEERESAPFVKRAKSNPPETDPAKSNRANDSAERGLGARRLSRVKVQG